MKKRKRSIVITEVIVAVLMAGLLAVGGWQAYRLVGVNLTAKDGEPHLVYVYPETTLEQLIGQVEQTHEVASEWSLRVQAKLLKLTTAERPFIRTGCYTVGAEEGNLALIHRLRNGQQTPVRMSFANIRTAEQLAGRLSEQLMLDSVSLIGKMQDAEYTKHFGMTPSTIVSLFLPDTYEVWWDITPDRLFQKMEAAYTAFWTAERLHQADALGLTCTEVATIASIVEEETNKDVDKPIIAGLYLNRLRIGMPLQSCPTVKYALHDFGLRRITYEHLQVQSAYNTYQNKGLPPGPIRIPTKKTLDFVLHATPSSYLYMCASDKLDGTHHFSSSYAEHSAYARAYQRKLNQLGIK